MSSVNVRMRSGAITAPVARTTPNSTIDTPKKTNDQVTSRLMCDPMFSASDPGGRNRPSACLLAISIRSTMDPVSTTL